LIDLDDNIMHFLKTDGIWYNMDAGILHTATNFGRRARVQLVVRQLLNRNKLKNPVSVALATTIQNPDDARFIFDNTLSPWFNLANKQGRICNFSYSSLLVKFDIENDMLDVLKNILPSEFKLL
jgi:hypothetical protein